MNQIINVPASAFNVPLPDAFRDVGGAEELGAGVTGGFGIVTYKGKVWRTKYRGEEQVLLAPDGRNPRPELEVIIVKAAKVISKVFYLDKFVDGSTAPPDCWSVNGVVPDAGAPNKQSTTCAGCKQNAWGSRITESGKAAKACADNKRLVIVPADDIRNESLGGPMMLRVPPTSLQDMANFGNQMAAKGFPYYAFVTRLRFDPAEAYPKFVFEAVRPLSQEEAKIVMEMREHPVTTRILEAPVVDVHHDTDDRPEPTPIASGAEELFNAQAAQAIAAVQKAQEPPVEVPKQVTEPIVDEPIRQEHLNPVQRDELKEKVQTKRPKFDPETGEKIVYADEQQSFPDIPSGLVRKTSEKPIKAEPKTEDVKVGGSFEDALDGLLGGGAPKK